VAFEKIGIGERVGLASESHMLGVHDVGFKGREVTVRFDLLKVAFSRSLGNVFFSAYIQVLKRRSTSTLSSTFSQLGSH
jgi:hypothetical protein